MARTIEVISRISCPFTHVGLERMTAELAASDADVEVHRRASRSNGWTSRMRLASRSVLVEPAIGPLGTEEKPEDQ